MNQDYSRIVEEAQRQAQQSGTLGQPIGSQNFNTGSSGQSTGTNQSLAGTANQPLLIQLQRTLGQNFGVAAEALKQAQIAEALAHQVVQAAYSS